MLTKKTAGLNPSLISKGNTHLIVFIDKTLSNKPDKEVLEKQQKELRKLIRQHLKANGDFLGAYAIHESTGPGSSIIQTRIDVPLDTFNVGEQTKLDNLSNYNIRLEGKVKGCVKKCNEALVNLNTLSSSHQTDIWATLDLIGQHTSKLPKQDKVTVLYISDMVESMPNGRRDFHKSKLQSLNQAKAFADKDLDLIRKNYLLHNPAFPGNITVKIWLPYNANATQNAGNMLAYWQEIFTKLGMNTDLANS